MKNITAEKNIFVIQIETGNLPIKVRRTGSVCVEKAHNLTRGPLAMPSITSVPVELLPLDVAEPPVLAFKAILSITESCTGDWKTTYQPHESVNLEENSN